MLSLPSLVVRFLQHSLRQWVLRFTHWYNMEHKHSQLRFVTPNERHMGEDKVILANRKQTIERVITPKNNNT